MFWVPGHSGLRGNEAVEGVRKRRYFSPVFFGQETALGGLWAYYKKKDKTMYETQHMAMW